MTRKRRLSFFIAVLGAGAILAWVLPSVMRGTRDPTAYSAPTGTPAAAVIGALSRAQAPAGPLPADVTGSASDFSGSGGSPGIGSKIDPAAIRLLRADLGPQHMAVWALPAANGTICFEMTGTIASGAGGCVGSFDANVPVAAGVYSATGIPPTVFGLAPDDVTGVDVLVDSVAQPASLASNVLFYQATGKARAEIGGVAVHYADGHTVTQHFDLTHE